MFYIPCMMLQTYTHLLFHLRWAEWSPQAVDGWISIDHVVSHPPWKPVKAGRWWSSRWSKVGWHRWVGPPRWRGWWPGYRPGAWLDGETPHGCFHSTIVLWPPLVPGHWGSIQLMGSVPQRVALLFNSPASVVSPHSRDRADAVRSDPWWVQRVLLHILGAARVAIVVSRDPTAHWVVTRWAGRTGKYGDYCLIKCHVKSSK